MKKMFFLFFLLLISSGCAVYTPLNGKLDYKTISTLQSTTKSPVPIALYFEKDLRNKVVIQGADGFVGGGSQTHVPIGSSLTNSLIEAINVSFSNAKIVEEPEESQEYSLVRIKAEKIRVGFEYSANPFLIQPAFDKSRVAVKFKIDMSSKNKSSSVIYIAKAEEKEDITPPPTPAGVMERCLGKIATIFIKNLAMQLEGTEVKDTLLDDEEMIFKKFTTPLGEGLTASGEF